MSHLQNIAPADGKVLLGVLMAPGAAAATAVQEFLPALRTEVVPNLLAKLIYSPMHYMPYGMDYANHGMVNPNNRYNPNNPKNPNHLNNHNR